MTFRLWRCFYPSIHNMTEVFTLSWDDFDQKCPKAFKELWLDRDLSDVTLATEDGGQLSAHKVILATCSPLFKRLLQKNPNGHPLLYLMGVQLSQLEQLLSYIYLGQCDLTQDQLPSFMATGKQLEVEGLSGNLESESRGLAEDLESPVKSKTEAVDRTLQITNQIEAGNKEGSATYKGYNIGYNIDVPLASNGNTETGDSSVIAVNDDSFALNCQQCDYKASRQSHIRQHVLNVHKGFKYDCTQCDYKSGDKSNLKRHIEKEHLGITYTCPKCKHVLNSKSELKHHVDVKHNGFTQRCKKRPAWPACLCYFFPQLC